MKSIHFIGGIHGVGKGTICRGINQSLGITTISASTLLKWDQVSESPENKSVKDIPDTQNRLIKGIQNLENGIYLIDGHFTLFDAYYNITKIELEVFQAMSLFSLALVLNDPIVIAERLSQRDGMNYDYRLLQKMQNAEAEQAEFMSSKLKVPLFVIKNGEYGDFQNQLEKFIKNDL